MKEVKEPELKISQKYFDEIQGDLEDEVDWNFDDTFLTPSEEIKKLNPGLAKVLDAHKSPAKKD